MKAAFALTTLAFAATLTGASAEPRFNWTGVYAGAFAGYGWGRNPPSDFGTGILTSTEQLAGPLYGITLGLNYQPTDTPLVFGIEGGLNFGKQKRKITDGPLIFQATSSREAQVIGEIRGRIGYAFDHVLVYATGGIAWARNDWVSAVNLGPITFGFSDKNERRGYALGAGVEYAINQNWSAKIEYVFYDFGVQRYFFLTETNYLMDLHTARIGINYRF